MSLKAHNGILYVTEIKPEVDDRISAGDRLLEGITNMSILLKFTNSLSIHDCVKCTLSTIQSMEYLCLRLIETVVWIS